MKATNDDSAHLNKSHSITIRNNNHNRYLAILNGSLEIDNSIWLMATTATWVGGMKKKKNILITELNFLDPDFVCYYTLSTSANFQFPELSECCGPEEI